MNMTNPDIGAYANNNYVPDIGQFGQRPDIINYTSMQNNVGPCNYPGNFTFAVPTSASQLNAGLQSNQHIGLYSSTYMNPQQVVPGMGVSWQHSVPNNMPWTDQVYGTVNSGVTTFSGKPTVSQSYSTVTSPRASCSVSPRRNKRHAVEDIEPIAPENKIFLTEEKMAARMQNLNISPMNSSAALGQPLPDVVLSSNMEPQYCQEAGDLQRLKELEKRLEEDVSESMDREKSGKEKGKPRLRIKLNLPDQVTAGLFDPQPILPQKILEDINKPNLQVVVWKPPLGRPADSESEELKDQENSSDKEEEDTAPVIEMLAEDNNLSSSLPLPRIPSEDIMDIDIMDTD